MDANSKMTAIDLFEYVAVDDIWNVYARFMI